MSVIPYGSAPPTRTSTDLIADVEGSADLTVCKLLQLVGPLSAGNIYKLESLS